MTTLVITLISLGIVSLLTSVLFVGFNEDKPGLSLCCFIISWICLIIVAGNLHNLDTCYNAEIFLGTQFDTGVFWFMVLLILDAGCIVANQS